MTGVGGFIAPRHLQAIKDTDNTLIAAMDPSDSVGVLDNYFPNASFFKEYERFDRHLEKLRRGVDKIDYVSICSPNFLHDAHIRMALRSGANVICEKPMVLNPWNVDILESLSNEYGKKIYNILQLRLHPSIIAIKKKYSEEKTKIKHSINLTYITSRGKWYLVSWKGNDEQSGGLVTNIGIHFFDMLLWIFGQLIYSEVHVLEKTVAAGYIELERAEIKWFLSINNLMLPEVCRKKNQSTLRSIEIDGKEIEFSEGFKDLHTVSYQNILNGEGFEPKDVKPSIELLHNIRNAVVLINPKRIHPLLLYKF